MLLAPIVWILTVVIVYFFAAQTWWFPHPINQHGIAYDEQFMRTLIFTGIIFINEAAVNPLGIDDKDPAGKDDLVSASLKVPAGKPIKLIMHSRDVIHNFFVRELRMKQDIVPGMEIPLSFQADTIGVYEVP